MNADSRDKWECVSVCMHACAHMCSLCRLLLLPCVYFPLLGGGGGGAGLSQSANLNLPDIKLLKAPALQTSFSSTVE